MIMTHHNNRQQRPFVAPIASSSFNMKNLLFTVFVWSIVAVVVVVVVPQEAMAFTGPQLRHLRQPQQQQYHASPTEIVRQPMTTTKPKSLLLLRMVPLSNEEIFARAATQQQQQQAEQQPVSLYDTELLEKMQWVLTLLDQRAVNGPLSSSTIITTNEEIQQLEMYLQDIEQEMRNNQHLKPQRPSPSSSASSVQPMSSSSSSVVVAPPNPVTNEINQRSDDNDETDIDIDDTITTNTYIIPNMDQMTPAEYQVALQETVIRHQQVRRTTGVTGNRSTWNYMNQLNHHDTGVMKKEMYDNDNQNEIVEGEPK